MPLLITDGVYYVPHPHHRNQNPNKSQWIISQIEENCLSTMPITSTGYAVTKRGGFTPPAELWLRCGARPRHTLDHREIRSGQRAERVGTATPQITAMQLTPQTKKS